MKLLSHPRIRRSLWLSVAVVLHGVSPLPAATIFWDVVSDATINDGDGIWIDGAGNWNNAGADVNWNNATPDSAVFGGGTAGLAGTVTLGSAITAGSLTFNTPNGGGSYIIDTGSFGLTLNAGITANESGTIQGGIGGSLILGGSNIWNVVDTKTLNVSTDVSGTGFGIDKTGLGTLVLSGANSFTGDLLLSAGTLRAESNAGALGAGTLTLNGGRLELAGDGALSFGRDTTVAVDSTIVADSLTLNQSTTHTLGALTIGAQTLTTLRGGVITGTLTGNVTFASTTLTGNAVFAPQTRSTLRLGAVSDGGNGFILTANGSGTGATVQLVGAGDWSGGTIVNSGTLRVDSADGLGANGLSPVAPTITTVNAGTLQLRNGNAARDNRLIDFQGTGTLQLVQNNNTTWNIGNLVHSAGNLTITAQRSSSTGARNHTLNNDLTLNGNLTLNVLTDITLLLGGAISEASGTTNLTKTGVGTARLGAPATHGGLTDLDNGELRMGVVNALPSGAGKGDLTFSPDAVADTATLNLSGFDQTINGISQSGANLGTSIIDNNAATAATLTIGANDGTGTFSGTIQNSGAGALSIVKTGAGLITLDGVGTYTGATTVNGGILAVQPATLAGTSAITVGTTADATLAFVPDGTGTELILPVNTSVTLGGGGSSGGLFFQLDANTATSDRITLSGSGALTVAAGGGVINGMALGGFTAGNYDLVTGPNDIVGGVNLGIGSLPGGFTYSIDTTTAANTLTLIATAAAGGDLYWRGDVDGSWAALAGGNSNWTTDAAGLVEAGFTPGAANTVNFSASNAGAAAINTELDNFYSITGLNILNSGTGAVTIARGVLGGLALGGGGIDIQTGAPVTTLITAPITLGAGQTWTVADSGSLLDVSGAISGAADLIKAGAGSLTLSGDNTMTGSVALSAGTLNINSATALGDGTGAFVIQGGVIDNTTGAGVALTSNNPQNWDGHFTFVGSNDLDFGAGTVTLGTDIIATVSANKLTVQQVTGGFGLTKEGGGTLETGAATDYSGDTIINAGFLQGSTTNNLSPNSAYIINAGGTLRLNNQSQIIGSLAGSGIVENNGGTTGVDILTAGGNNLSTVFSGTLQDGVAGILRLDKVGTGTLELSGTSTGFNGNLTVSGGMLKITGTVDNVAGGTGTADINAGVVDNTTGIIYVGSTGNVTTDTITLGNGTVARSGSLLIDGGSVTLTNVGAGVAAGAGGYGYMGLQSGSLTAARLDASNNGNGTAVYRIDGGTATINEYIILRNLNAEFTVTGGQVLHNGASQNIALNYQNGGTTVMSISGATVNNTGRFVTFGQTNTTQTAGYTGILNLNAGGNLITERIVSTQRSASTSTVNFNGGTLTASINEAAFFNAAAGLTTYVHGGGAFIDTAGSNVTISEALLAPFGEGLTSLTLSNVGSGYIGAPYVKISGGSGTGATAYATVDLDPASGTFGQLTGVVISNPGTGYVNTDILTIELIGGDGTGAVIDAPVFAANVSGGLTKQGAGTLVLTGLNSYAGGTTITAGTLALGVNDALMASGSVTIQNGAFFDVATFTNTVGQVALIDGNIAGSTGVLTSTADYDLQNGTVSAILAGSVGLNKSTGGTVALSGANTFTGAVSVTGGTLAFSAADQLGDASATNTLSVNGGTLSYTGVTTSTLAANQILSIGASGATLDTAFAAGVLELTGGINTVATANLIKTGPGTVTVTGSTDLNGGAVTVAGGTLNAGFTATGISGVTVAGGGALNLFDNAAVTVAISALSLADGSALGFDLNAPGINDVLALSGAPTVAGTISINLTDLGGLAVGSYDLITVTAGALNGASYTLGAAPSGLNYSFDPTFNGGQTLRLTASNLQLRYWTGDQDGSWSTNNATNTNWSTAADGSVDLGALPGASDALIFSATNAVGPSLTTTLDGSFTVDSIQFIDAPTSPATTAVFINQGSSGSLTIAPVSSNNGLSVADNGGAVTIAAPLVVGANQTWEVIGIGANGSSLSLTGDVTFTNAVTKTGDGALTLSGTNSGPGGLIVNGGTLNLGSSTAPGAGTLTTGAGVTLDNTSGAALTLINNNALVVNGSFIFTGSDDLNLGSGTVTLGNNAVVNVVARVLTVGGVISDGGNNYALTKDGAGTLVLNGANTQTGGTSLTAGTLHIGNASALGSGAFSIGSGTTFDNITGGALTLAGNVPQNWNGDFAFTGSSDLNMGAGAVTMNAPVAINVIANTLTVGGVIDDGLNANALTKTGAGTLFLGGLNTYDGRTLIDQGTVQLGVTNALPALTVVRLGSGGTAGILDLNGFDQTIAGLLSESTTNTVTNEIKITAGQTLTINGEVTLGADAVGSSTRVIATGGGNLVINSGGSNFQVGGSTVTTNANAATVDLSGLANLTADLGLGTLKVGDVSTVSTTNTPTSDLRLATNNTITAGLIAIGEGTSPQNLGNPHSLILGSGTNIINANTIAVGSGTNNNRSRSSGEIVFDALDNTGTLKIRGSDGTSPVLTIHMVNSTATTGNTMDGKIDLTGHTADVLVNDVNMARRTQGNGSATATLTFDQGTFELVDDLVMAHRVTTGTGNATATINIGGGTFIVGDDTTMSLNTGDNAASITTATINITGGDVTFNGTISMANAVAGQTANSAINITGGTFTSVSSISRTGGGGTENAVITLDGGTFDMTDSNIGTAGNPITFNARSGTLMNLNNLNGGGALEKTTGGTLILEGTNDYSGATIITAGTLQIGSGGSTGTLGVNTGDIANEGTLAINRSDALIIGNNITGTGGVSQIGAGTTTLSGASTYSGPTTVTAGTLQLGDGGTTSSLSSSSAISMGAGATFAINQSDIVTQGADFSSAAITGAGAFAQTGAGTTILNAANTYSGGTVVTAGTLEVNNTVDSGTGAGAVIVSNLGSKLAGSGSIAGGTVISGGAVLAPGMGDTSLSNHILTFTAAGTAVEIQNGGQIQLGLTSSSQIDSAFDWTLGSALTYLDGIGGTGSNAYLNIWSVLGDYDSLKLTNGTFSLGSTAGGTIKLIDNSPSYAIGNIFKLLDWGTVGTANSLAGAGSFTLADLGLSAVSLGAGLAFDTSALTTYGVIVIVPEPSRAMLIMLGLVGLVLRRHRKA